MALPPPLPTRGTPPPLPTRNGPPPLPSARVGPYYQQTSWRDVQRVGGKIENTWIKVVSTNVNRIRFDPDYAADGTKQPGGTIYIEFLSLATYMYKGRTEAEFLDLYESSSKGRAVYYGVRGPGKSVKGMGIWPSVQVRKASRRVTAEMRQANEPLTAAQARRTFTVGGRRGSHGAGGVRIR